MPQFANITVKKNDGTTDVTYTGVIPSGGDKTPAVWRSQSAGTAVAFQPTLQLRAQSNGPKTARRVETSFVYQQTAVDSTTGLTQVVNRLPITVSAAVPMEMPQNVIDEAISQCFALHSSTLIKDCFKTGAAAT